MRKYSKETLLSENANGRSQREANSWWRAGALFLNSNRFLSCFLSSSFLVFPWLFHDAGMPTSAMLGTNEGVVRSARLQKRANGVTRFSRSEKLCGIF